LANIRTIGHRRSSIGTCRAIGTISGSRIPRRRRLQQPDHPERCARRTHHSMGRPKGQPSQEWTAVEAYPFRRGRASAEVPQHIRASEAGDPSSRRSASGSLQARCLAAWYDSAQHRPAEQSRLALHTPTQRCRRDRSALRHRRRRSYGGHDPSTGLDASEDRYARPDEVVGRCVA
jgi:hypothetical protein